MASTDLLPGRRLPQPEFRKFPKVLEIVMNSRLSTADHIKYAQDMHS